MPVLSSCVKGIITPRQVIVYLTHKSPEGHNLWRDRPGTMADDSGSVMGKLLALVLLGIAAIGVLFGPAPTYGELKPPWTGCILRTANPL